MGGSVGNAQSYRKTQITYFRYTDLYISRPTKLVDYAAWKLFIDAAEMGSLSKTAVAYGTSQPHITAGSRTGTGIRRASSCARAGDATDELGKRIAPDTGVG